MSKTARKIVRSQAEKRSGPRHRKRRWPRLKVSTARALRAALLIVGLFAAIGIAALGTRGGVAPPAAVGEERSALSLIEAIRDDREADSGKAALPAWFAEEFFSPAEYFDTRCNEDATVISLSSARPAQACRQSIEAEMEARGWTMLSTGAESMTTAIRKEGMHSWALLWCDDVGGQSTILIQTLPDR